MAITVNNKFPLGSFVFIKTDNDQLLRQVISVEIFVDGSYQYKLACGTIAGLHFECELSTTRNIVEEIKEG